MKKKLKHPVLYFSYLQVLVDEGITGGGPTGMTTGGGKESMVFPLSIAWKIFLKIKSPNWLLMSDHSIH